MQGGQGFWEIPLLIRDAPRGWLKRLNRDATLLEAASGDQAIALASEHSEIQLVLVEANLADRMGFSVLAELHGHHPATSVILLSARGRPGQRRQGIPFRRVWVYSEA
jgi:response regulator RpfG family c-di-GMP phosphodiesterase